MRKPPNEQISEFLGPEEVLLVVFGASRVRALFFQILAWVVLFFAVRLTDPPVAVAAVGLALWMLLVNARWFDDRYTVGVVEDDVIVVQDRGYWGWPAGRFVGRWPCAQGVLQLREGRVARLRVAGAKYTVRGEEVARARLAARTSDAHQVPSLSR